MTLVTAAPHSGDPSRPVTTSAESLAVFELAGEAFAISVHEVFEAVRMVTLRPSPGAPPWHAGFLDLHGRVLGVVDLRARLGLPTVPPTPEMSILLVETPERTAGLVVDSIVGVAADAVLDQGAQDGANGYVTGIARADGRLLMVLDPGAVLSDLEEVPEG